METESTRKGPVGIRFPAHILKELDTIAEMDGSNRARVVLRLVRDEARRRGIIVARWDSDAVR